jgi:hypothetical protein
VQRQADNRQRSRKPRLAAPLGRFTGTAINRKLEQLQARVENRNRLRQELSPIKPPGPEPSGGDTITLNWEIFPPGTIDEVVRFFSEGMKSGRNRHEGILRERVEAFMALSPEAYIRGVDRFNGYIGAKVSENLVVFENWRYGNALYILYENWRKISKQSRLDLLQDTNAHFDRIIHGPGWRERLEETIRRERPQGATP